ncbi:MAG TPA: hypothetical protein VEG34_07570 [Thermoanaerobaculia bacterium]|nr:hypothetical protein [Thermoanaerobaculia bacterium]
MHSCPKCSSPSAPPPAVPPPSIFSPEFLARLHERDEAPTAAESDLSGPWRTDPVPGRPGWVGVVRTWEGLESGDIPRAVFDQEELARLCAVALPLLGRDPLFHLGTEAGAHGYPVTAVDGEQGPRECGALALFEPELAGALHLLQGLIRSPAALAAVNDAAGPGALAQVGRILAGRWVVE